MVALAVTLCADLLSDPIPQAAPFLSPQSVDTEPTVRQPRTFLDILLLSDPVSQAAPFAPPLSTDAEPAAASPSTTVLDVFSPQAHASCLPETCPVYWMCSEYTFNMTKGFHGEGPQKTTNSTPASHRFFSSPAFQSCFTIKSAADGANPNFHDSTEPRHLFGVPRGGARNAKKRGGRTPAEPTRRQPEWRNSRPARWQVALPRFCPARTPTFPRPRPFPLI